MLQLEKIFLLQNQDEGNWLWKTENQRNQKNEQIAVDELHQVWGGGRGGKERSL